MKLTVEKQDLVKAIQDRFEEELQSSKCLMAQAVKRKFASKKIHVACGWSNVGISDPSNRNRDGVFLNAVGESEGRMSKIVRRFDGITHREMSCMTMPEVDRLANEMGLPVTLTFEKVKE
jgi:hypothetical protein